MTVEPCSRIVTSYKCMKPDCKYQLNYYSLHVLFLGNNSEIELYFSVSSFLLYWLRLCKKGTKNW